MTYRYQPRSHIKKTRDVLQSSTAIPKQNQRRRDQVSTRRRQQHHEFNVGAIKTNHRRRKNIRRTKNVAEKAAGSEQVGGYKSLRIKPSSGNKTFRRNKNAAQQRRVGSRMNIDGRRTTSEGSRSPQSRRQQQASSHHGFQRASSRITGCQNREAKFKSTIRSRQPSCLTVTPGDRMHCPCDNTFVTTTGPAEQAGRTIQVGNARNLHCKLAHHKIAAPQTSKPSQTSIESEINDRAFFTIAHQAQQDEFQAVTTRPVPSKGAEKHFQGWRTPNKIAPPSYFLFHFFFKRDKAITTGSTRCKGVLIP